MYGVKTFIAGELLERGDIVYERDGKVYKYCSTNNIDTWWHQKMVIDE